MILAKPGRRASKTPPTGRPASRGRLDARVEQRDARARRGDASTDRYSGRRGDDATLRRRQSRRGSNSSEPRRQRRGRRGQKAGCEETAGEEAMSSRVALFASIYHLIFAEPPGPARSPRPRALRPVDAARAHRSEMNSALGRAARATRASPRPWGSWRVRPDGREFGALLCGPGRRSAASLAPLGAVEPPVGALDHVFAARAIEAFGLRRRLESARLLPRGRAHLVAAAFGDDGREFARARPGLQRLVARQAVVGRMLRAATRRARRERRGGAARDVARHAALRVSGHHRIVDRRRVGVPDHAAHPAGHDRSVASAAGGRA